MVQIDLTLEEDPVNDKPVRAGNGGAAAPVGVRSPKDKQQLMTEYLSPSNSQPAGSGDGSRRRERRALRASAAASGAGSSSSSKENPTVIYLSSDSDGGGDEDHACGGGAGGSQPRLPPLREIPGAPNGGHMHRGGGVANAGHSSSSSSSRGGRPAVRDQVPDDEPVIISDSEGEDDEPASPQPRLISKSVGIPPPPRPAEPSGRRKRSPSPAMPDDAGDKRARVGQTTPDHISGNDAAPISGPGSSLGIMMAEAELDAALALEDDDEHSMLVKRERDSEAVSKRLEELQEFYDRNFGGAEGGDGSKPRKPRGCSVCGQKGHNRRNCPTRSEQAAEEMEGGSGRGGGNARVDDLGDKGVVVADTESGGSGSGSGSGAVSGVCGASTSSSRRGGDREWLWDEDSQLAFRNAEVSSQTNLGYPHGKLWPVLRREAAMGGVAPAYVVRMMVEALLDPGMLEKMQNDADWKDLKGAKTEHLQHLFAGICHLIPAIGSNRFLPLEAPRGPRSYGQVNPCSELCADVMAAVKLLGTGAGEKGGRVGKAIEVEKLLSDDGGGSAAEKAKAEKCRQKQARKARADAYFRLQNVKFLKFIAALAASERACVEAGTLGAACHLLVEGIKPKAMLGTRQVDLKDVVRMCVNTADCANASPEEKGVVGEVLREIIAANSRSRGARLGEVLSNVEQLGEKRVGHGASCALEAMLGVPRWTLDWLMARWSAQCPGGEAASWHASMSLDQSWQSVCSACTRDTAGKSHRPCQFAEEPGIDLALRLTVVRAAAASLGMAPGLCQGVLLRWLGSQAQQAAREGVEDMRWKAGFALATD